MNGHKYSKSEFVLPMSREFGGEAGLFSPKIADLTTPRTLKVTLGLTRHESYWHLFHSGTSQTPHSLSTRMFTETKESELDSRVSLQPPLATPEVMSPLKGVPSDRDYQRIMTHLDRVINGSSMRYTQLCEGKPLSLSLNQGEWLQIKVKVERRPIPLQVAIHRSKGRLRCFVIKSFEEPTEKRYEELHYKDVIKLAEPGLVFKLQWISLAFQCLEEADFMVASRFGQQKLHTTRSLQHVSRLADIDEFRHNDTLREALYEHVSNLLTHRRMESAAGRNFIRSNKAALGKIEEELRNKREMEKQRRELALAKHKEVLREKKIKAEFSIRRREIRLEKEAKELAEKREQERERQSQRDLLQLIFFFSSLDVLWSKFSEKHAIIESTGRQMHAARVLQRCYRKVKITINPRKVVSLRAMQHFMFLRGFIGPELMAGYRWKLFKAMRNHYNVHKVSDNVVAFMSKGEG